MSFPVDIPRHNTPADTLLASLCYITASPHHYLTAMSRKKEKQKEKTLTNTIPLYPPIRFQ